jgi:hypothetical protein
MTVSKLCRHRQAISAEVFAWMSDGEVLTVHSHEPLTLCSSIYFCQVLAGLPALQLDPCQNSVRRGMQCILTPPWTCLNTRTVTLTYLSAAANIQTILPHMHSRLQQAYLVRFIHSRCQIAFRSPICPMEMSMKFSITSSSSDGTCIRMGSSIS